MSVHDRDLFRRPAMPLATHEPPLGQAIGIAALLFAVLLAGLVWAVWP